MSPIFRLTLPASLLLHCLHVSLFSIRARVSNPGSQSFCNRSLAPAAHLLGQQIIQQSYPQKQCLALRNPIPTHLVIGPGVRIALNLICYSALPHSRLFVLVYFLLTLSPSVILWLRTPLYSNLFAHSISILFFAFILFSINHLFSPSHCLSTSHARPVPGKSSTVAAAASGR
jgi:hypothetical protein